MKKKRNTVICRKNGTVGSSVIGIMSNSMDNVCLLKITNLALSPGIIGLP